MPKNSAGRQKYEVLKVKAKALETERDDYKEALEKSEAKRSALEDAIRKHCELDLAKDRSEMRLGTNYTWRSVPTVELITKATASSKKYDAERTDLLKRAYDLAEDRRVKIEGIMDQNKRLLLENEALREQLTRKGMTPIASVDEELPDDPSYKAVPVTPSKSVLVPEDDNKNVPTGKPLKAPTKFKNGMPVVEVDHIVDDEPSADPTPQIAEMLDLAEQISPTSHSIPTYEPLQKVTNIKKKKEEAVVAHMVDLKQYEKKMNDASWLVMEAIGKHGISSVRKIEDYCINTGNALARDKSGGNAKVRAAIQSLSDMAAISKTKPKSPGNPNRMVYRMTSMGNAIYKHHFGESAVMSELDRIIQEHDNPEHGYGIMDTAEVMKASGRYDSVSIWNRKDAVKLGDHSTYIPDIVAIAGTRKEYIEYERGHHTQEDFNAKCNKMCKVSRFLHFVVPNEDVMREKIIPQIQQWIRTRGSKSLTGIVVKVSAFRFFKDNNPGTKQCWQVIFHNGSDQPIYNKAE